jgi:hypothetical protein
MNITAEALAKIGEDYASDAMSMLGRRIDDDDRLPTDKEKCAALAIAYGVFLHKMDGTDNINKEFGTYDHLSMMREVERTALNLQHGIMKMTVPGLADVISEAGLDEVAAFAREHEETGR